MSGKESGAPQDAPAVFLRTGRPPQATVLSAIADSEAELCRRLDSLEIIAMEIREALASGSGGSAVPPGLQDSLEAGLDRIAALTGARAGAAMAERAALGSLHKALGTLVQRFGAALDRLEALPAAAEQADAAEPSGLVPLLEMLGETVPRLDAAVARFEEMPQGQDIGQALAAALEGCAAPASDSGMAAGLRAEISAAGDRIARLVGTQDHRFEAEKQRLGRFISALEAAVPRLESAAADRPDEARIAALEAALQGFSDRHAAAQAETLEAVRDMGMVVAEMLARHERESRNATRGAGSLKS